MRLVLRPLARKELDLAREEGGAVLETGGAVAGGAARAGAPEGVTEGKAAQTLGGVLREKKRELFRALRLEQKMRGDEKMSTFDRK